MRKAPAIFAISVLTTFQTLPQNPTRSSMTNFPAGFSDRGASPAYEEEAFRLTLAEVNTYAAQLKLPETLPVTAESIREKFVAPPHLASRFGALGSLRTTNYSYAFGTGKRLSYITRLPKDKSKRSLYERMKPWSIDPSMINTNAARMMATQFLAKAFVDVPKLAAAKNSVSPMVVLNMTTSIYTVEWQRGDQPLVQVTFDERKAELWSLRVEDPAYILRRELDVPDLDQSPAKSVP
jgi:hypothetical protein